MPNTYELLLHNVVTCIDKRYIVLIGRYTLFALPVDTSSYA